MRPPTGISTAGVLELRQYTLRPGARPDLVRLFEGDLIEPQESSGMCVAGVFLDRDDADRFVWFRGFTDMQSRRRALEDFYFGPVWKKYADAANATMLDSDDVLLLGPTDPAHPAPEPAGERAATGATKPSDEWVAVSIYVHPPDAELTSWMTQELHDALEQHLSVPVATYRTEPAENDFPRLPVRRDNAFVWMAAFSGRDEYVDAQRRLEESSAWRNEIAPRLEVRLTQRQYLRLQPTARSQHAATGTIAQR